MSQPTLKVTEPTPQVERSEFISSDPNNAITQQPQQQEEMKLTRKQEGTNHSSDSADSLNDDRSSTTVSEVGSGYDRDSNECTEFCIECFSCFGLFESCCPSNGEGCLTSTATFCGNVCFSFCKYT